MTQTPSLPNRDRPLVTDHELHQTLEMLLRVANQRQVWLVMLGDDKRVVGPLMPMSDYPDDPEELIEADDLGPVTFSHALMARSDAICGMTGGRELVFVWERLGTRELTPSDISWARAVAREASGGEVPKIRAQFVLHNSGLRQLRPDDLL